MAEENFRVRKGITVDGSGYSAIRDSLKIGYISTLTSNNTILGGNDAQLRVSGRSTDYPGIIQLSHFDNNNFYGGTGPFTIGKIQFAMNENSNNVTTVASIEGITSDPNPPGHFDGALRFFTSQGSASGANLTEKMTLTADGDVGIGVTPSAAKLEIGDGTDLASINPTYVQLYNSDGSSSNATVKLWAETWGGKVGTTSGDDFFIHSAGSDRLKFDGAMRTTFLGSASADPILRLTTLDTSVSDTDDLGVIEWVADYDSDGGDTDLVAASVSAVAEADFTATANTAALVFKTATSEAATEKMRISNTGNVGIGTTSPSTELEVAGIVTVTGDDKYITFDGGNKIVGDHSNDGLQIRNNENEAIVFKTNGNNIRMSIEGDGKVGIGTTSPDGVVHIKHTDNTGVPALKLETDASASPSDCILRIQESHGSDTYIDFTVNTFGQLEITGGASTRRQIFTADDPDTNTSGVISLNKDHYEWDTQIFGDSSTPVIFVDGTNNRMGVGTTSPGYLLDVAGAARFTGTPRVENTLPQILLIDTDATNDPTVTIMNNGGALSLRADSENVGTGGRIEFTTSGTERMRLTDAGKLGIGTTSPAKLLHLESTMPEIYMVDSDATNTPNFRIFNNNGNANYRADDGDTGTGGAHLWYTSGTERMRLTDAGNLGIGTTGPAYNLEVEGSGNAYAQLTAGNNTGYSGLLFGDSDANAVGRVQYRHTDNRMTFYTNASEKMRIDSSGNVGIGTTNPSSPLDVTGSIELSSNLHFNGAGGHYIKHEGGTASSDNFTFRFSDNEDVMIVRGDGRVGIGDTTPSTELEVAGTITATGLSLQNGRLDYGGGVQQSGDLAVGWYTFAVCKGRDATTSAQRAFGEFLINDVDSGRHGSCRFNATHFFGNGNSIQVFAYNFYSTAVFTQLRIKESGTYAGAALQVYVSNANNNLESYMTLSEQNRSWDLLDTWLADSDDSGHDAILGYASHSQDWSGFTAAQTVDLSIFAVSQGGIYTTGGIYGEEIELKDGTGITIQTANSNARHKKIFATTSNDGSPWDEMVYYSRGSIGGWSGQHTFTVDKNGTSGTGYEALRIRDSGDGSTSEVLVSHKLGVGTTSPDTLFEIKEGGTGAAVMRLRNSNTSYPDDTAFGRIEFYNADASGAGITAQIEAVSDASGRGGQLAFKTDDTGTSPSTAMFIQGNGKIGINTVSPNYQLDVNGDIRAIDDIYTDKLIASQGIRSSSRASFNTMQMYYYDRQNMGTQTILLRVPVGGSSTANPSSYTMPHAGQVMQVMYQFYGSTFGTGTDTWKVRRTDTNGNTAECDFTIAHGDVNQIGSGTTRNILKDISALDDSITFSAGDIIHIERTTANINLTHVSAQLWVTFDI